MFIKCRFLKDGQPKGREYTYQTDIVVKIGDKVTLPSGEGVVTAVDVPEEEMAAFRDKIKAITGKVEESEEKPE